MLLPGDLPRGARVAQPHTEVTVADLVGAVPVVPLAAIAAGSTAIPRQEASEYDHNWQFIELAVPLFHGLDPFRDALARVL